MRTQSRAGHRHRLHRHRQGQLPGLLRGGRAPAAPRLTGGAGQPLLGGRALDPAYQEDHHLAIRRLNDRVAADERMNSVRLPVRDGLTIARRR
ncbi:hypothetical protein [Streptomyces sp. NPDC006335]|uniref:hypothetical protein n=1 Tax=Streptomyces sp. NPDC006335 TaxID=3156895 RepID=UPI0033B7ABE6